MIIRYCSLIFFVCSIYFICSFLLYSVLYVVWSLWLSEFNIVFFTILWFLCLITYVFLVLLTDYLGRLYEASVIISVLLLENIDAFCFRIGCLAFQIYIEFRLLSPSRKLRKILLISHSVNSIYTRAQRWNVDYAFFELIRRASIGFMIRVLLNSLLFGKQWVICNLNDIAVWEWKSYKILKLEIGLA